MESVDTFFSDKQASKIISKLGSEFAVVKNPDYIHPEFEYVVGFEDSENGTIAIRASGFAWLCLFLILVTMI